MSAGMSPEDIEEEEKHFQKVVTTFRQYGPYALAGNNRRRKDFFAIPRADQELLASVGYKEKLAQVDQAIFANASFLNEIVASPGIFEMDEYEGDEDDYEKPAHSHSHEPHDHDHGRPHTHGHTHDHGHPHDRGHAHDHSGPHEHDHGHPREHKHIHPPGGPPHSHGGPSHSHSHDPPSRGRYKPTEFDMEKLRSTLKQFVRDWSADGLEEREASYKPVKDALLAHFSNVPSEERHNLRVLVPGAGLGRLAYDVAKLGFSCQGNEFSQYMLLSSYFILNRTDEVDQHTIYPYVHSFSNVPERASMLRAVRVPDVLPGDIPPNARFSLVAGDFEEIYGVEDSDPSDPSYGQWDAILTCFFIDTAKNIVNYLRIIHNILAPGGVWINVGPLLWHFENNTTNDTSVELDLDEVKALARAIGFEIENERTVDTAYVNNKDGMMDYIYHAAFWTATKVARTTSPPPLIPRNKAEIQPNHRLTDSQETKLME